MSKISACMPEKSQTRKVADAGKSGLPVEVKKRGTARKTGQGIERATTIVLRIQQPRSAADLSDDGCCRQKLQKIRKQLAK